MKKLGINTFLLLSLFFLIIGCSNKDDTTFFSERNFEDKSKILEVINGYNEGINSEDLHKIMLSFPKDFKMPDDKDNSIVHSYSTIENDFKNFFERSSVISYKFDDIFLTVNEKNCRANFKVSRKFNGHAPFNYSVNDEEYETIYLEKRNDNNWYFTTISHRLLPPAIEDLDQ